MSTPFESLVALCRISNSPRIAGTDLHLHFPKSADAVSYLNSVESDGWVTTLRVDGVEVTKPLQSIVDGTEVDLVISGMTKSKQVVANNVSSLLREGHGRFYGEQPETYYLLDERYASWEDAEHKDVLAYRRAIRMVGILKRLEDVIRERQGTAGEVVLIASRKLVVPIVYDSTILNRIASLPEIESFEEDVFRDHHRDARRDIAKRVLVRFLDAVPEEARFSDFMTRLPELHQSFLADFDIYSSGFSFDKAREEFERKKLDFVVKINAATSDVMNKLIAIPVGQGLLVSQMKKESGYELVNFALIVGSVVFVVIAVILIVNQVKTLLHIKEELYAEKKILQEKARPTYEKLRGLIESLEGKLRHHIFWVPVGLALLISVTTAITFVAYFQFTGSIPPADAVTN
jgi:hypothetical protein